MVTEGIIKVWFFFFFSRGVLQLRRGPVTAEICIRSGGAAVCANYSPSSRASLTNTSPQTRAGGRGLGEAAAIPLADGRCGGQERKLQEKSRSRLTHGVTGRGDPPARRGTSVWTWGYFQGITRHFWQERRNFKRQNALLSLFLAKGYNFTAVFFSVIWTWLQLEFDFYGDAHRPLRRGGAQKKPANVHLVSALQRELLSLNFVWGSGHTGVMAEHESLEYGKADFVLLDNVSMEEFMGNLKLR